MSYSFAGLQVKSLYGQHLSISNIANNAEEKLEIQTKKVFSARSGTEAYGFRVLHRHKTRGEVHAFLKVFRYDLPQRRARSAFLVKLGLAKHHEWIFQGVPYAWFNRQKVNGVEFVGHLTKFIGLQYGKPAEDFTVLKAEGDWDAFNAKERRAFASHLASAVCGLERLRVVHGDLSPGNVMIGPGPGGRGICCLCDFDGFYHPSQPLLPRKFEGGLTRPLGSEGYQYPSLIDRIKADKNDDDETIVVETDRFALAVLICEMMVWDSSLTARLGRPQLLDERVATARRLSDLPDDVRAKFPSGFALLEKALNAGSADDMPTPDEWLKCLGVQSVLPTPFKSPPQVLFYRRGAIRRLHGHAVLNTRPNGNFGVIDAQLAAIAFHRDDSNQVTLKIGLPVPGALRRAGNQQTLSNEAKSALAVMPGDLLHIGDWEIVFEESAKVP